MKCLTEFNWLYTVPGTDEEGFNSNSCHMLCRICMKHKVKLPFTDVRSNLVCQGDSCQGHVKAGKMDAMAADF